MANKSVDKVLQHIRKLAAVRTYRESGDCELLELFVTGKDEAAFAVLFERHGPMVLGVSRRTLGNSHDAEDACQASFLVLAQKAAFIRKTKALSSWLHGVASRVAANLKRERFRRCRRERENQKPRRYDPAEEVTWREVQAALDEELRRLPEYLRAPLILCYLDGRTRDEVARQLGLTVGGLHGRLERGRRALCKRLTRRGVTLAAAFMGTALGEGLARAALSPTMILATAKAAMLFAGGRALDEELISAEVFSLAQEVLKSMFLSKLKLGVSVVVCTGLLLSGIGGALASVGAGQQVKSPPPEGGRPGPDPTAKRAVPATIGTGAEDAAAKEAKALEGEWEPVAVERYGKKLPLYEVRSNAILFTFKGEELKCSWFGKGTYQFKLDPSRSPREIDITQLDDQQKGRIVGIGIYSLEEGRLRLCFRLSIKEVKRPTEFRTGYRDDGYLYVLERVMPKGAGRESDRGVRPGDASAEQFGALLREWRQVDGTFQEALRDAKTAAERQKVTADKAPKLGPFAARCLKLAESFPDTSAELAALCWAVSNAPASEAGKKALAILKGGRIARADLDELGDALGKGAADWRNTLSMTLEIQQALAPLVLERVKQKLNQSGAAELLDWVCTCYLDDESAEPPRTFAEAADLIAGRFADSPDINHLSEVLGVIRSPPWAGRFEKHLRAILKATRHAHVRLEAEFALASIIQEMGEGRQEEARKLYRQFVKVYDGRAQNDGWDGLVEGLVCRAKDESEGMLVRGIGEPAPEIAGEVLDGRPMKLSDFRGKVVLVSFWATWCAPCMKLVPHEESLVKRLKDKPFVIVGVNGDSPEELTKAQAKLPVTWRSLKDDKKAIRKEWKILAFPTLFLIDHKGIIRKRWIGAPPTEELDCEIDRLIEIGLREK